MCNDRFTLELLSAGFKRTADPKRRKEQAGIDLLCSLKGHVDYYADVLNDPIAKRIQVHIGSMMPHLINVGGR